jgi:hypothetical protein
MIVENENPEAPQRVGIKPPIYPQIIVAIQMKCFVFMV